MTIELFTWLATFLCAALTALLHIQGLHRIKPLLLHRTHHGTACAVLLIMALHIVEIIAYGVLIFALCQWMGAGDVVGASKLRDYLYFSATSYTSLGFGDLYPLGPVRILVGIEALVGLTMIGWTVAYTYPYIVRTQTT